MFVQKFTAAVMALLLSALLQAAAAPPVTISENAGAYILDNGIVTARVAKNSGDLLSLKYKNLELLAAGGGRQVAYWSHNAARGRQIIDHVTIDPQTNGGEHGEVSIKGVSGGNPMGGGPGGTVIADIEIRYALGRGNSGIYTYCAFSHPTNYPATSVGEARFCMKLNDDLFDWMTVDANRNMKMISADDWNHGTQMNMKEARRMNTGIYKGEVEHKYDYSANQFDVRAWGWSSSAQHVGIWLVNPSVEYLSGGPTKFELSAHRDATFNLHNTTAPAPPTLLNYWRSSHYGGSICNLAATDDWTKVIGPFLIYCNSGNTPNAMWHDALAEAGKETKAWPFDWVNGVDYPHKNERATVTGKIILHDPQAPRLNMTNLLVGLTAPDHAPAVIRRSQRRVDWQTDAKNYQFWVRADDDGNFSIPNVRAGNYSLHAIADGVLGELIVTNITVAAGKNLTLGKINWRPVRYGKQLWDIGIPNRTGAEFFKGDDYFHWGWYLQYPKLFPHNVNFIIGQSDFHKDWFFEQVPFNTDTNNVTGTGRGNSTTWKIIFNLTNAPHGKAALRLALCGIGTRSLSGAMNGHDIGTINHLLYNATINRDGIGGTWCERDLVFNANLMQVGANTLELTIPAGSLTSGIIYDYLRLELDENAPPPEKPFATE